MEPNLIQPQNQPQPVVVSTVTSDTGAQQPVAVSTEPNVDVSSMASQLAAVSDTPETSIKSRHGFRLAAIGVAGLALFVGGYFANYSVSALSQSGASKQAEAFVSALNAGDSAKAYALTSNNLRSQQSEGQFTSSMGDLKASNPVKMDRNIGFNGNTATYTVTEGGLPATDDGTTSGTFSVSLVRSGLTNWKIDSASVQ